MDDIIYQSNNQNSVFVLNSNYRTYGDYPRLNLIDPNNVNNKNVSNCQDTLASSSGNRGSSAGSRTLPHKLHNLGNFCEVTEIIGNTVTSPPSLSVAALSTTTTTATTTPPATGCLPQTPAFQTFFNCSYVANVTGGICTNAMRDGGCSGGCAEASNAQRDTKIKTNNNNKKKCANVKASVIAKKTKFRKFIEEEKCRTRGVSSGDNVYQYSANSNDRVGCTGSTPSTEFRNNSCVKESNAADSTTLTASMAAMVTCGSLNNIVKHYWNGKMDANAEGESKPHQHQNQSNNWSGSGDSNNHRQRQHLEVLKSSQQQRSNYELYKEAAVLLGLSCTLCDNCRCLECQSSYFDCEDSDSLSELSNSDEYDDDTMNALNNSLELVMYANCYSDDAMTNYDTLTTQQRSQQKAAGQSEHAEQAHFMCNDANHNAAEMWDNDGDNLKLTGNRNNNDGNTVRQTGTIQQSELYSEQRQQENSFEHFTNFNELRLTDDDDNDGASIDNENNKAK